MNTVKIFGVGAVSAALILLVVIGGYNLLALNLGIVSMDYFIGIPAVIVLLGGTWLSLHGIGYIGKPFILAAVLVMLTITVKSRTPGVAELFTQTSRALDRTAHTAALNLAAPREIPCDRTTATLKFFLGGKSAVWLSEDENRRIICWDRPGQHPVTNKELVPIDERFARLIRMQPPPAQPSTPVAATPPAPVPEPTPLPDLSEGPIR